MVASGVLPALLFQSPLAAIASTISATRMGLPEPARTLAAASRPERPLPSRGLRGAAFPVPFVGRTCVRLPLGPLAALGGRGLAALRPGTPSAAPSPPGATSPAVAASGSFAALGAATPATAARSRWALLTRTERPVSVLTPFQPL